MALFWAPECSSWFLGVLSAEVDDVWDGSWRHCFVTQLYFTAKPAHMGIDVDGPAYPLHRPMVCNHQTRR
jgi:hypothetical protein